MTSEERILAWIERADFDGTGCRHSQETIAQAIGCSRRTVIRAVQTLAADGRISVGKERRPGCPWVCNVYRIRDWNPHKRSGVLGVLAAIREARRASCHTEGTATAEEGSYAHDTSPSVSPSTRCQHAARASRSRTARRACVCHNCTELEAKLSKASDELVDAYGTIKTLGKRNTQLERELSCETSPLAQDVRRVLEFWQEKHPSANIDPLGSRARVVRGAMKLGHTDPPLPCPKHDAEKPDKGARCTVADELIEAVEGLRLMPFTGKHGRCATAGPGTARWDGIEYALTDRKSGMPSEATIERFRGYARRSKLSSSEKLLVAYQLTGDVHETYARYLLDALARENGNGHVA
jgi:DNA-binding Lrp family transcriptional regulator